MRKFIKDMHNQFLVKNAFYILMFLKQHNDYEKMLADMEHEDDCYNSPSLNYLM